MLLELRDMIQIQEVKNKYKELCFSF